MVYFINNCIKNKGKILIVELLISPISFITIALLQNSDELKALQINDLPQIFLGLFKLGIAPLIASLMLYLLFRFGFITSYLKREKKMTPWKKFNYFILYIMLFMVFFFDIIGFLWPAAACLSFSVRLAAREFGERGENMSINEGF